MTEPPRLSRRLHHLRGWSDGQKNEVFPGGPETGVPHFFELLSPSCLLVITLRRGGDAAEDGAGTAGRGRMRLIGGTFLSIRWMFAATQPFPCGERLRKTSGSRGSLCDH